MRHDHAIVEDYRAGVTRAQHALPDHLGFSGANDGGFVGRRAVALRAEILRPVACV